MTARKFLSLKSCAVDILSKHCTKGHLRGDDDRDEVLIVTGILATRQQIIIAAPKDISPLILSLSPLQLRLFLFLPLLFFFFTTLLRSCLRRRHSVATTMARQLAAVIDNGTGYTKMGYPKPLTLPAILGWLTSVVVSQATTLLRLSSPRQ